MDEFGAEERTHKIEIVQREQVRLQGVIHVESFDEQQVVVETDLGMLTLSGEEFHITSLDLDKGLMIIEGNVGALEYSHLDRARLRQKDKGFLQRLFR
ncbi:MAG TPA: sporulation protein YabP [Firmicutes bacterium]|nr:sporulation protein YabP [Candidatus Fermentithermobacillaceae bacterium]